MIFAPHKSPEFVSDLEETFIYIANDDFDAAVNFLTEIEENIQLLSNHPRIGNAISLKNEKLLKVRAWVIPDFRNYRIFYRLDEDKNELQFLRFLNTNRDFDAMFDEN